MVRSESMLSSLNVRRNENSRSSSERKSISIRESINPVSNKSVVSSGTTICRRSSNMLCSLRQMVELATRLYSVLKLFFEQSAIDFAVCVARERLQLHPFGRQHV